MFVFFFFYSIHLHCFVLLYVRYNPRHYYDTNPELKKAVDQIQSGFFSPSEPAMFHDVAHNLLNHDT